MSKGLFKGDTFEDRLRIFVQAMKEREGGWDTAAMETVEYVSASPGKTEWTFTVTESMCNWSGNLHGGCAATLMDNLTSTPAFTLDVPSLENGTVSRTLTCTYLKGLPMGSKCRVVAECVRAGRTLMHFRGDIIDEKGDVAVTCTHDKAPRPVMGPKL